MSRWHHGEVEIICAIQREYTQALEECSLSWFLHKVTGYVSSERDSLKTKSDVGCVAPSYISKDRPQVTETV